MNKLSESLWNWKGEISREKFTKIGSISLTV